MRTQCEGMAIVLVLVVSAVALLTMLFASSMLTVASRSAASSDRNATQALLAADSGLKTLKARGSTEPYSHAYASFTDWIADNFSTLDLGGGVTATITVVAESLVDNRITVQSTGRIGNYERTVVQDFSIIVGPPIPLSASVPGALTSVGSIKSNSGAARVYGMPNTEEAWTTTQIPLIDKSKTTYRSAVLCDSHVGEYVRYDSRTYRVENVDNCPTTLELTDLSTGVTADHPGETVAAIRTTAIVEEMPAPSGTPPTSVVEVTPGTRALFGVGTPISIGGNSSGEVVAIEGNEFTIEWTVAPGTQPEGTIVRRAINSGVTMGSCPNGRNVDSSFPDGCEEGVDLTNLFYKTFGVASPNFLKDSLPASHRLTGSQATDGRTLTDITWVTNPANNFRDQKGSGVLIIETNPGQSINLNVSNDFIGLIYVIGDASIQGNAQYHGAIIVDGTATVQTDVQGTTDIHYDPMHLIRALADIEVDNPNPGGLGHPVANTWRIR